MHDEDRDSSVMPDRMKQVQQKLADDGEYHGLIDGRWGPATSRAVSAYQSKNSLHVTGQLDDETITKMDLDPHPNNRTDAAPLPDRPEGRVCGVDAANPCPDDNTPRFQAH
jgi:peptidoglycan hydrolase-like protein with peptidoglycan-binding domain